MNSYSLFQMISLSNVNKDANDDLNFHQNVIQDQ